MRAEPRQQRRQRRGVLPAFRGAGAWFDADRSYRYALWRIWDPERATCNFLMLNPSTADERTNDPTVERCQRRAERWGYGGLVVTNLFALCSTDPAGLRRVDDPIGPENDAALVAAARGAGLVLYAWGNHGAYLGRAGSVRRLLADQGVVPYCLAATKSREPAHPLHLSYARTPVAMDSLGEGPPERIRVG